MFDVSPSIPNEKYRKPFLISMLLIIPLVFAGNYFYNKASFSWFFLFLLLTLTLSVAVLILTSRYYGINILPVRPHDLLNEYEKYNTRFISTNAYAGRAKLLAAELFKRSYNYIYIYTGMYNKLFYEDLKPILDEKKGENVDIKIISTNEIEDEKIVPQGVVPKEKCKIEGKNHFIVSDYGVRLEISDMCGERVDAIFFLNLLRAKNIEKEVTQLHHELKTSFEKVMC